MAKKCCAWTSAAPLICLLVGLAALVAASAGTTRAGADGGAAPRAGKSDPAEPAWIDTHDGRPPHVVETLRGKVVWLEDGLKRLFNVRTDAEAEKTAVALETTDGQLVPLTPDLRGHAFTLDERLREMDVQMVVRRFKGSPYVQIIRLFHVKPEGLYEVDYWCDICAIPMFVLKECECCHGPIRLREELVTEDR